MKQWSEVFKRSDRLVFDGELWSRPHDLRAATYNKDEDTLYTRLTIFLYGFDKIKARL